MEAREADSSLSDSCAIAVSISVDTGTLSPDIVDAVDPCDPGTDPRTGPLLQVPPVVVPLNLT